MTQLLHHASTATLHVRDGGDGRTLVGPVLPWGIPASVLDQGRLVTKTFERGALAGTTPSMVPLTATHPRDAGTLPIGVTVELEERADAAWGAWHVSDTMIGNEVLALARDGVPLGLSIGFAEVPGGSGWSPDRKRVTRTRAALDHIAVVRVPAYRAPGWSACAHRVRHATPRCSSPSCTVGKGNRYFYSAPTGASKSPPWCLGCGKRIRFGERCHRAPVTSAAALIADGDERAPAPPLPGLWSSGPRQAQVQRLRDQSRAAQGGTPTRPAHPHRDRAAPPAGRRPPPPSETGAPASTATPPTRPPTWSPTTWWWPPGHRMPGRCGCCAAPRTADDRPEF
jgi:phage head maturation protease